MKHIQVEPDEVFVLHRMTLQDLRTAEMACKRAHDEFSENAMAYQEVLPKLEAAISRIELTRKACERDEAQKHLGDGEQAAVVHV